MIIKRKIWPGGDGYRRWSREEAAIAAKIRAGVYDVVGVSCAEEYEAPGGHFDHITDGQKRERHELCLKADHEEMMKDPWYAELRRRAESDRKMRALQKSDRVEYEKAYSGYLEEISQQAAKALAEREARNAEWMAAEKAAAAAEAAAEAQEGP